MARLPGDPSPIGKLRFACGVRLADRHRDWVRHDLTDAGWRWRALGRHLLLLLPFAAGLAALPGPAYLHWMLPLFLVLTSTFVAAAYADDMRASRLRQHRLEVPVDPDLGRPPNAT